MPPCRAPATFVEASHNTHALEAKSRVVERAYADDALHLLLAV